MPSSKNLIINGRYALSTSKVRKGGMAEVYLASDLQNDLRHVAVKVFSHGQIEEKIIAESFRRETQALRELKHPRIVELVDSGFDQEIEHHFLVMEWMEKDLNSHLKESPPEGWNDFWQVVAYPLLEGLAFSHKRNCIHRDIKPSNILVGSDNHIKLGDFGISKLKRFLQPGITLKFGTEPFTPPESDDGSYSYTRDVFSFGVLVLKCLTNIDLTEYGDIPKALDDFDAPAPVQKIIERAVSREAAERQTDAQELFAELIAVQEEYIKKQRVSRTCYVQFTNKSLSSIQDTHGISKERAKSILIDDLNSNCGIVSFKPSNPENYDSTNNQYSIFGESFRYHVKVENSFLVIISAQDFSSSYLQQNRERAWRPSYRFIAQEPLDRFHAQEVLRELEFTVEEHEANRRQIEAEEAKQRLFRVWGQILKAKLDWEKEREKPIAFKDQVHEGSRIIFQLSEPPEEDIDGQPRYIANTKGYSILSGDIEEVRSTELKLYIKDGDPQRLPKSGVLLFDTRLASISLNRQKNALDAIQYERAVNANIGRLLREPTLVDDFEPEGDFEFFQSLNPSQEEVVKAALTTPDFLIVQGPPGTGKTTFITEVVLQTLKQDPQARILLSSQTHVALDNALERIQQQSPDLALIRIGNHERVPDSIRPLLLEQQMEKWRNETISNGENFLAEWSSRKNIERGTVEKIMKLSELQPIVQKLEVLKSERLRIQNEIENFSSEQIILDPDGKKITRLTRHDSEQLQQLQEELESCRAKEKIERSNRKAKAKAISISTKLNLKRLQEMSSTEIHEYFSQLDLNDPNVVMLQKMLSIRAEWIELFGRNERFNSPLIRRSQVTAGTCVGIPRNVQDIKYDLCIVDEASKATATEVLVPLAQSKRWILVGDPKQLPPFKDEASRDASFLDKYDLEQSDLETLFDYLYRSLPETHKTVLKIQHRMVAPIGNLISHCFYEGNLESARKDIDPNLIGVLPKAVTWFTTAELPDRKERKLGSSFNNDCEAKFIIQWLEKLNQVAVAMQKTYSVAVLSGYASQLLLLNRYLAPKIGNWQGLQIECNTVDAFQGREADIAVYSIVRSNERAEVGFLREAERLNVALSRARVGLAIIGDHFFCRTCVSMALRQVLDYVENHHIDCALVGASI